MTPDENEVYVSPTSDEIIEERYARIIATEAAMTETEIQEYIQRLQMPSEFFDWEGNE